MNKYRCKVCSYLYAEDTPFTDLPEDWLCPLCGAPKSEFEIVHRLSEEGEEKHVPIIEVTGDTVTVRIGSAPHPMEEAHYITMVELYTDKTALKKKNLNPNEEPIAIFENISQTKNIKALAHCNLHGVWES